MFYLTSWLSTKFIYYRILNFEFNSQKKKKGKEKKNTETTSLIILRNNEDRQRIYIRSWIRN